jgi:hypothetical protein
MLEFVPFSSSSISCRGNVDDVDEGDDGGNVDEGDEGDEGDAGIPRLLLLLLLVLEQVPVYIWTYPPYVDPSDGLPNSTFRFEIMIIMSSSCGCYYDEYFE